MNEQTIRATVEMCWRVACEAHMSGVPPMLLAFTDQYGMPQVCMQRMQTYQALLAALLPKSEQSVRCETNVVVPKEPWQE